MKTAHTNRTERHNRQWSLAEQSICICTLIALVGGIVALAARPARADDSSITIVRQDGLDATYDGYLVLSASVGDDDHAEDVSWPSDEMRIAILSVLDAYGYEDWFAACYPHSTEHDSARAAAEFLTSVLEGTETRKSKSGDSDRLSTRTSLSNELARALTGNDALAPQTASANEAFSGAQGYWLFVSHEGEEGSSGTAPLFVTLGGSTKLVAEKASHPSITAEVREDATGTWGQTADAQRGQLVSHRITATLPHNLDAYDQYHCHIDCTLPEGMTLYAPQGSNCAEALAVSVGGHTVDTDVAPLTASYEGNVLSVDIADLIDPAWDDCDLAGNATVSVGFDAYFNDTAQVGAVGNLCTARLTSTTDPVRGRETSTAPVHTIVFSYGLNVLKVDDQQGSPLAGAAFTLAECTDDAESTAQSYIQANGSRGAQPHEFVTDSNGTLHIACLDEGRYLLRETKAPQGYELPTKGIELRIEAERLDESLSLGRVTVSVSSGDAEVTSIDESSGTATLRIRNKQATTKTATQAAGTNKPTTSGGSVSETTRRLAQTGVGALSIALVGIGLALRSLSAFALPSEDRRRQRGSCTRGSLAPRRATRR